MDLLQINKHYLPFSGGTIRVVDAVRMAFEDRLDMTILTAHPRGWGRTVSEGRTRIVTVSSAGLLFSLPLAPTLPFRVALEAKRHRRVLLHFPFPGPDLALLLAASADTEIVIWWHSDIVRQELLIPFYRPVLRAILSRSSAILVSDSSVIEGSDQLSGYENKCDVVPYGLDISRFSYDKKREAEAEGTYGAISGGRPLALFVGRLVYYKGVDVLLRALSLTRSDLDLAIVGIGSLGEELRGLAEEIGVGDRVHFLGELSEDGLEMMYRVADFLVLPSVAKSEAFGLVQIEAMAAGCPVINTDLPTAVPKISLDGQTGLTVPAGDARALAEALDTLAENPGLRSEMGERARERAKAHYSLEAMANKLAPFLLDPQ